MPSTFVENFSREFGNVLEGIEYYVYYEGLAWGFPPIPAGTLAIPVRRPCPYYRWTPNPTPLGFGAGRPDGSLGLGVASAVLFLTSVGRILGRLASGFPMLSPGNGHDPIQLYRKRRLVRGEVARGRVGGLVVVVGVGAVGWLVLQSE